MENTLSRTAPEKHGIASAAVLEFIESAERDIHELHSFMLLRHGSVVAEGWWTPHRADLPHMLYSLSKSFTSSAIGMAVAEGRLSVEDKVIDFFPDETPAEIGDNLAAMRVHHLLSMGTGHDKEPDIRNSRTWVKGFLATPVVHEPGTHFLYNSIATYMLSAIVQKLTGMRLLDYLRPRLLDPLGIEGATWEQSPEGIDLGGWGMKVKTEDIARFGQLYLQKGIWKGKRILSEDWIARATSKQISNGDDPKSDWAQGYCYQFWRCRHNAYRGDGAHGQYCVVMPEQDAVLAITSGVPNMQGVLDLVWDCLLPAMGADRLPENAAAQQRLLDKLASLTIQPPPGRTTSPTAAQVSGRTYRAEVPAEAPAPTPIQPMTPTVEAITLAFGDQQCTVTLKVHGDDYRIACGYGAWVENSGIDVLFMLKSPAIASGVWIDDDTFSVSVRLYETPFVYTLNFCVADDQLVFESRPNVGDTTPFILRLVPA